MVRGQIDRYRNQFPQTLDASSVKDLGMQSVSGKKLHAYSFVAHGVPETIWIGANDLPVQARTTSGGTTTTIVYRYTGVSVESP